MSHTIQAQRLIDLGLLGIGGTFSSSQGLRFYMTEIQLIPGAFAPGTGFTSGARVNGAPNGTQRTTIDGMDGTNQINAVQAGTGTSVDAIQETAIQTSNFAAEFGQVGGGLFNITMRSGTNQYHGGGFDYLQNEAFNGATPFVNKLPRTRRNDYGYSLGGPVWIPKVYRGKTRPSSSPWSSSGFPRQRRHHRRSAAATAQFHRTSAPPDRGWAGQLPTE
jgi:hypothetical protein